jgi:hypothetical protein
MLKNILLFQPTNQPSMKVSFVVAGSSMLFAISPTEAHMAKAEPRWNFGAADASMCEMNAKQSAGAHWHEA